MSRQQAGTAETAPSYTDPVRCARSADLGCQAAHKPHKWATVKAGNEGWFHSRETGDAFCPDHVPEWVAAWRAKKAARKPNVHVSYSPLPAVLMCEAGDLTETWGTDPDGDAQEKLIRMLQEKAMEHARATGHTCTVTDASVMTVSPQ